MFRRKIKIGTEGFVSSRQARYSWSARYAWSALAPIITTGLVSSNSHYNFKKVIYFLLGQQSWLGVSMYAEAICSRGGMRGEE